MRHLRKILDFYIDGFRGMTVGRTLWTIILVKIAVIFLVLKVFFFPNYIGERAEEGHEAEFVNQQIIKSLNNN
ncbi:MAG: DUF4492 domain-containing protein [Bacteroidaceae bacterium]|nr:DUF4492 domain-containing protein [Bacteroidaceae bacterium]